MRVKDDARVLVLSATFHFTMLAACVKAIADRIPVYETVFFRSFISAVLLGVMLYRNKISFRAKNAPLLLARSLAGLLAMSCEFYALGKLAFGDNSVLGNLTPAFVALLSFLFLGERPTKRLLFWLGVAFFGVLLVLRPQFGFLNYAGFIAMLAGFFRAIVIVVIHESQETDPFLRVAFYFMAASSLVSFPVMLQHFVVPNWSEWLFLLAIGLFGTLAQIHMTRAYGLSDVSPLAPLSYVGVVLSYGIGLLFWREVPTLWSLLGSLLIILCCIRIARLEKAQPVIE